MQKVSLLLILAILLMAAASSPAVRVIGESQEPEELLEAESSPEEFADFRKVLQRAGGRFRSLLPESFPQTDYRGVSKAVRNLVLETHDKVRSYLKFARTGARIREMTAALMEAAGGYVADSHDASLEWWTRHKDQLGDFLDRYNLDPKDLNSCKEAVLEILDDVEGGNMGESSEEWAGQVQEFLEDLEIDWGSFPDLFSPWPFDPVW